jgi:VWFA-related protein
MSKVPAFWVRCGLIFSLFMCLAWVAVPSAAQQQRLPPPPTVQMPAPPPGQDSSPEPPSTPAEEPVKTFKVGVDVVQVLFNVKDKKGGLIPSQTKDDFEVSEEGKPQTIKYFAAESDLPLTLGILIDTSGSQERVLPMEQEVGGAFLKNVLRAKDLAFVLSFDVNVELLQDFTSSPRNLQAALDRAKINTGGGGAGPIPGLGGGGPVPTANAPRGTLLYDAIYLASHDELAQEVGRKAMIILTDGEDFGSQLRIKDAIEAAQKADAICYVLLIADREGYYNAGVSYTGEGEMNKLSKETGGRVIDVGSDIKKLKQAFDQIGAELRSQYSLGYTPTNDARDGTFRKIEIRSKKGYKIQARAGRFAPPESAN